MPARGCVAGERPWLHVLLEERLRAGAQQPVQSPPRGTNKIRVKFLHVGHVHSPVIALPEVVHEPLRRRVQVPTAGEKAHGHEYLLAKEEHEQLRIVGHLAQDGRRGEGEVRAPEEAPPGMWPIALERPVPYVQDAIPVEEARAVERGSEVFGRDPVGWRAELVAAAVAAEHGFRRHPRTPREFLTGPSVPMRDEAHVAVQLQVELLAAPEQLRQVTCPTWAPRLLRGQLNEPYAATEEGHPAHLAARWQGQQAAGRIPWRRPRPRCGSRLSRPGCPCRPDVTPELRQVVEVAIRERVASTLPHQTHGEQLRAYRVREESS
mmetsp:Transcript_70306/g.195692  ORF Transcript_70306/g.195692 Transcript_70306/m.195692 type:complete len:321 (-) Transcript_70306:278-1240(-)